MSYLACKQYKNDQLKGTGVGAVNVFLFYVFQLSNQESVNAMLQMASQELLMLMCDRLAQSEEAAYRWRAEIEGERTRYLATEDRILMHLR